MYRGRSGKTISGNGQAWSSPSPRGQWRTYKKWRKLVAKSSVVPQRPSRLRDRRDDEMMRDTYLFPFASTLLTCISDGVVRHWRQCSPLCARNTVSLKSKLSIFFFFSMPEVKDVHHFFCRCYCFLCSTNTFTMSAWSIGRKLVDVLVHFLLWFSYLEWIPV